MNNKLWMSLSLLFAGVTLAAGTSYSLRINGTPSNQNAIVVSGQTYVPLSALQAHGVTSSLSGGTLRLTLPGAAQGGANARPSVEGCQNEALFNGLWRLRVTKVAPVTVSGVFAWAVTVELKNGSEKTRTVFETGVDTGGKGLFLTLKSGNTLSFDALTRDIADFGSQFAFAKLPPGAALIYQLRFYTDAKNSADAPAKFLFEIDPRSPLKAKDVVYSLKEPSFRVRLDCKP